MMSYTVDPETIHMTLGSVGDADEGLLSGLALKHIYLADKPAWYQVPDDGLPRFDTMPNEKKYLIFKD
jgi:hypothetical protein